MSFAQQPRIDSLAPAEGPIVGGTIVTIKGANFSGATVKLDRAIASPLSQTDSEIRLQVPRHENRYVVISVVNASGSAYGEYLYIPPPLDSLPPGFVTTIGGVGNFVGDGRPATRADGNPTAVCSIGTATFICWIQSSTASEESGRTA